MSPSEMTVSTKIRHDQCGDLLLRRGAARREPLGTGKNGREEMEELGVSQGWRPLLLQQEAAQQ